MIFHKIVLLTHVGFAMRLVKYSVSVKAPQQPVIHIMPLVQTAALMASEFLRSRIHASETSLKTKQPLSAPDPWGKLGGTLSVSVWKSHSPSAAYFLEPV